MKRVTNSAVFDSSFIGLALDAFFGLDVLQSSSVGGKPSNSNQVSHNLDPEILTFIHGMSEQDFHNMNAQNNSLVLSLFHLDIFSLRVKCDAERLKHFNKFINKKCNNVRRIAPKSKV